MNQLFKKQPSFGKQKTYNLQMLLYFSPNFFINNIDLISMNNIIIKKIGLQLLVFAENLSCT